MKYLVRVSELRYGNVVVEALSEAEAKTVALDEEISYSDGEITDITAEPIKTNADMLRKMGEAELARFLTERSGCPPNMDSETCATEVCESCWTDWLQSDTNIILK